MTALANGRTFEERAANGNSGSIMDLRGLTVHSVIPSGTTHSGSARANSRSLKRPQSKFAESAAVATTSITVPGVGSSDTAMHARTG